MNDAAVRRRTWPKPVWLALSGLAGLIAAFFALRGYCNPGYTPIAFTAEDWAEADQERRGHMVRSLLAARELMGLDDERGVVTSAYTAD